MTARRPACALLNAHGVICAADAKLAALYLLEMTFQTEIRVACGEHLGVHRAVCAVARGASFMHRLMFEYIRAALSGVAFHAAFVLCFQGGAAAQMRRAFVGRMTFDAGHPPFGHGMVTWKIELAAHLRVTCETSGFTCA